MKNKPTLLFVAGARPNFMKIAPLLRAARTHTCLRPLLVHTGQHYDYRMSESFFHDLEIPRPDYFLNAGSGTHAEQTAAVLIKMERVCRAARPAAVIVVGDVNSTLAATLAAKKLCLPVAHIEAGLRSFDRAMPEELNRIATDSIADLLFVTEQSGRVNLLCEGHPRSSIFFVGNTMIDSLVFGLRKLPGVAHRFTGTAALKKRLNDYCVATLHRPANVDDGRQLARLIKTLGQIARHLPVVFPVHPRTRKNMRAMHITLHQNIHLLDPLGYLEFLFLYKDARCVLTDSGGMQEETTFLRIPCFTLRTSTERPCTITLGTNVLVKDRLAQLPGKVARVISSKKRHGRIPPLWDGRAAPRIIRILRERV